ncbi:recombinase family protein [Microbacterium luteolum]|uniref:Recombinase family protein n=1 Tax=Microbacterium luteolum TaxID=69367 RepID=A0ABY7XMT3_MICLT|nr:recombinase family protein [Microbacterium luteolum]WDM43322.1 recombinase family protein [Microbacterium luteolum]
MAQHTQVVGYVRVSSSDQNEARQLEAIGAVDRIFAEKVSAGSRFSRVALEECIRYVRDGDIVRVASMDRLARSMRDLRQIIDELLAKGAAVEFVKESQTYSPGPSNALANLMLNMLGAFAEFERALIRERQAEGIQLAKKAGKYRGRNRKLASSQVDEIRQLVDAGVPKSEVARRFEINRSTVYRLLAVPKER